MSKFSRNAASTIKPFLFQLAYGIAPTMTAKMRFQAYGGLGKGDPLLALMPGYCRTDGLAVDAGAALSYYAYVMSARAKRVHAFEPNPALFKTLVRTMPEPVTAYNVALSDAPGVAQLRIPQRRFQEESGASTIETGNALDGIGAPLHTVEVRTLPLDAFCFADVSVIKIDVEGHELAVLQGAAATIRGSKPAVFLEAEDRHRPGAVDSVVAFFAAMHYGGWFIDENASMQPLDRFVLAKHQNVANVDAAGERVQGLYVNNFLFLPEGQQPPAHS